MPVYPGARRLVGNPESEHRQIVRVSWLNFVGLDPFTAQRRGLAWLAMEAEKRQRRLEALDP